MKVALLIRKFNALGGIEKYASYLAKAFHEKGCHVTILTTGKIKKLAAPFQIISFPTPSLGYLELYSFDRQCREWLKQNPMEIVFGMDRNTYQTYYRAGNGVHAAYLQRRAQQEAWWKKISFKINPLHRTILNFEKQTFENPKVQCIFTNSHMVKKEIIQYYQTPPEKIKVVHNGVEWCEMQNFFNEWPLVKNQLLKQLHLPNDCFHLVFIGNEYRRKGLPQLLKALSSTKNSDLHLSVVGKDRKMAAFQHLANKLHLSKRVTFFGQQHPITPFYQIADCVVIPSLYDPFANVTIEALAMGCFVLSSNQNGGSEILNMKSGRILNNLEDVEEFANALNECGKKSKTFENSQEIRNSVKTFDFGLQLRKIVDQTQVNIVD